MAYVVSTRESGPVEPEIRMLIQAGTELTAADVQSMRELAALLFPGVHGAPRR